MIAREQLVEETIKLIDLIYYKASRFVKSKADTEDICQQVFLKVLQSSEKYDSSFKNPKPWVLTIANNLIIDSARKKQKIVRSLEECSADIVNLAKEPYRALQDEEVRKVIEESIENLIEQQKSLVRLHYFEEMQYKEISYLLEIPIGTVKSRLNTARAALKKSIEEVAT